VEYDVQLEPRAGAVARQRDPRAVRSEADQVCVAPCPRREALRADVQRLEEVRLPGSVRPDDERQPWLQLELEPRVRAEIPKRDAVDDQA
jgi:hypothetical protein